tara:strand:- start:1556 stop:3049 length:1494 start_codon:yes stop_codon:yes gene_type:complete
MMKVLLIAPYINLTYDRSIDHVNREDFYPSAALIHLAAILRANNFEVRILDFNNSEVHSKNEKYLEFSKDEIIKSLNEFKPNLVGLNCLFSGSWPDVLEFAKLVKSYSKDLKIATGGIHPTTFPKEILENCKEIDYVAIGEGENSIVALSSSIKQNKPELLKEIKSFAFRDESGVVHVNKLKNYVDDLGTLPMPAWDLIDMNKFSMDLDHYYNPTETKIGKFKAAIFSSRACPLACNFCDMFLVMGKKHRKRSIKAIIDEVELLHKEYGVNYFSFMDDQLTLNRAHTIEMCNEMINRNLKIIWDTPNGLWINSLREDVIAKMAEAGLARASLAVEHGDDYIRNKVIGKILERKKVFEVADLLKKYKIMTHGQFIMGFPEDTNETLKNSYDFINEIQLDKVGVGTLVPFPETKLYEQVVKEKLWIIEPNYNELWKKPVSQGQGDFIIKPHNMTIEDLYYWRSKFDEIQVKYWRTNPKSPNYGRGLELKDKVVPRFVHE